MPEKTLFYELALTLIEGIGGKTAKQLIAYCGSAQEVFRASKRQLLKIPSIGEKTADNLLSASILQKAENQLKLIEKTDIQLLSYLEEAYPHRLKSIEDAPILLYYKGNTNLNVQKSIAIVGTRQATSYGEQFVHQLIQEVKKYNPLIVSGLAYGIDIMAHRACLEYQIPTVGVMANGLDIVYPAVHKNTTEQMLTNGGVLSENPIGTKPDATRFPARNRIIAGMADAVIVVEARKKGGALITAEIANSYNKEVFALPGDVQKLSSEGCNNLIKNHQAQVITTASDLAYFLNWDEEENSPDKKQLKLDFSTLNLDVEEMQVLTFLENKQTAIQLDEFSRQLAIPTARINALLMNLELQNLIKALPGKKFMLK